MTKWCCGLWMLCFFVGGVVADNELSLVPSENEGLLRLPEGISVNVVTPEGTPLMVEPENGRALLPVGRYKLRYWDYQKQDEQGNRWELRGYGGPVREFHVGPEPVELDIKPEPVEVVLDVRCQGGYLLTLSFKGPAGERLYLRGGQNPNDPPQIIITNHDKTFSATLTGKYG